MERCHGALAARVLLETLAGRASGKWRGGAALAGAQACPRSSAAGALEERGAGAGRSGWWRSCRPGRGHGRRLPSGPGARLRGGKEAAPSLPPQPPMNLFVLRCSESPVTLAGPGVSTLYLQCEGRGGSPLKKWTKVLALPDRPSTCAP